MSCILRPPHQRAVHSCTPSELCYNKSRPVKKLNFDPALTKSLALRERYGDGMNEWAIWVDIEGFSQIYPRDSVKAFKLLGALMTGIYIAGNTACASSPNSIFAYQTGDGFIIGSEFGLDSPRLPLGICISLLKLVALSGGCAKCAVSTGNMADIQGCYPKIIQDHADKSGCVPMGFGLMTTFPVMGTALINAHNLSTRESGAVLIWDRHIAISNDDKTFITKEDHDYLLIDWVHSASEQAENILIASGANGPPGRIEAFLLNYVKDTSLTDKWRFNTLKYNRLEEECSRRL